MVAALLALQVKFGVLQFSGQSLGFLLQLLDVSLGLLIIGLQVADLCNREHVRLLDLLVKGFFFSTHDRCGKLSKDLTEG